MSENEITSEQAKKAIQKASVHPHGDADSNWEAFQEEHGERSHYEGRDVQDFIDFLDF